MEKVKIRAFGILAEKLPESEFDFPATRDTQELLNNLRREYPVLQDHKFSMAMNSKMVQEKTNLQGGEEIALLPPFSGG